MNIILCLDKSVRGLKKDDNTKILVDAERQKKFVFCFMCIHITDGDFTKIFVKITNNYL
jgi:hypothetical protein